MTNETRRDVTANETRRDVLVLGGGIAGLAAASTLTAKGLDVVILEARSRFGGRIWTLHEADDEPIELGAEFVHGAAARTAMLAREAHIAIAEGASAERWDWRGSLVEAPELGQSLHDTVETALATSEDRPDRSFAASLGDVAIDEGARARALEYVQSFQAGDAGLLSTRALSRGDLGDERSRHVAGGYDLLVRHLVQRVPASAQALGRVVVGVRWERDEVEVVTSGARNEPDLTFSAHRAIVALPLGVLPGIAFAPSLDRFGSKATALGRLATGHALRVTLRFREAFWSGRMPTPSLVHVPGAPWPVFWTGPRPNSKLLVAWAGGPAARALEAMAASGRSLEDSALDVLSGAFAMPRDALAKLLTGAWTHDWTRDPFARGAYSYPRVGGADAARALAAPLEGTLFFAGEATSEPPENGSVEGALASGYRAAEEVIASLR